MLGSIFGFYSTWLYISYITTAIEYISHIVCGYVYIYGQVYIKFGYKLQFCFSVLFKLCTKPNPEIFQSLFSVIKIVKGFMFKCKSFNVLCKNYKPSKIFFKFIFNSFFSKISFLFCKI